MRTKGCNLGEGFTATIDSAMLRVNMNKEIITAFWLADDKLMCMSHMLYRVQDNNTVYCPDLYLGMIMEDVIKK